MSTRFLPIEIPPGVVTLATKNMRSSNWAEVNMIRWVEGVVEPVGGQQKLNFSFASRCKAIHPWVDLAGNYYVAYLCETNVYVESDGALYDITPTGGLAPPAFGASGYGDDLYNKGLYGIVDNIGRPPLDHPTRLNSMIPNAFSIDNFGAILLCMTSPDERLLMWDPGAPSALTTKMTEVTAGTTTPDGKAPKARAFVVTQDRFVMLLGMQNLAISGTSDGSLRRFGWCDQENFNDWNFSSVTNKAGFYDLEPASPIMCGIAGKFGVLFFTAKKAYSVTYVGLPYVYGYQEIADDCTPYSPQSITTTSSLIMWMSQQGAFSFDGSAVNPVACLVRDWIIEDIDPVAVREQAAAAHLGQFSEFWWFFPQNGQRYNTRAAVYNYKEGWWAQAQMPRSAGMTSSFTATPPLFADGTVAYQHESGIVYPPGSADLPWAETFDLNLNSGGRLTTVKQMMIDLEGDPGNLQFQLFYRMNRLSSTPELVTPTKTLRPDGYLDLRTTGRDIRLRFEVIGPNVPMFDLGQHLIDSVARGDR